MSDSLHTSSDDTSTVRLSAIVTMFPTITVSSANADRLPWTMPRDLRCAMPEAISIANCSCALTDGKEGWDRCCNRHETIRTGIRSQRNSNMTEVITQITVGAKLKQKHSVRRLRATPPKKATSLACQYGNQTFFIVFCHNRTKIVQKWAQGVRHNHKPLDENA